MGAIIFVGILVLCCCCCCAKICCGGGPKYPHNSSVPVSNTSNLSTTPIVKVPASYPGTTTTFTTVTTTTTNNTTPTPTPTPVTPIIPVTPTAPAASTSEVPYGSSTPAPPAYNPSFVNNNNSNTDEEIVVEAVPVYDHTGPATYYK